MSLLNKAQEYYQRCLEINPAAHACIKDMGIESGDWAMSIGLGWIDGEFKKQLTVDERKQCGELGLFNSKHVEKSRDVLSIPLFNNNEIAGFATYQPEDKEKLLGGAGIVNQQAFADEKDILLVDSFPLYVTLRQLKYTGAVFLPAQYDLSHVLNGSGVEAVYAAGKELLGSVDGCDCEIRLFTIPKGTIDQHVVEMALENSTMHREMVKRAEPAVKINDKGQYIFQFDDYEYSVTPITLNSSTLKCVVTVSGEGAQASEKLDLYALYGRKSFSKYLSETFLEDGSSFEQDLQGIVGKMEGVRDQQDRETVDVQKITESQESEIVNFLNTNDVIKTFYDDMDHCGIVGEELNKTTVLLTSISRLLDSPISLIISSSSASGKSTMLEVLTNITPIESVIYSTRLSPQALYHFGENGLKHKLLIIDESQGKDSESCLYAIRSLQSQKRLVTAMPVRDPVTGGMVSKTIVVNGPCSICESTTSNEIHPENASRCLVIGMDLEEDQTKDIIERQKLLAMGREVVDAQDVYKKWQHIGKVIAKHSKPVVIPFADQIEFPTNAVNARRDFLKFLSLIKASAMLNMFQREIANGTIQADIRDYETAYKIFFVLLRDYRDELTDRAKELLKHLREKPNTDFSRRELMEALSWKYSMVYRAVKDLEDYEIVAEQDVARGYAQKFRLLNTFLPDDDTAIKGLLKPETLQKRFAGGMKSRKAGEIKG